MGDRTWPHLLNALLRGEELSTADTAWAMGEIMSGAASAAQVAGFAVGLRAKGETSAELAGLVEAMLTRAVPVSLSDEVRSTSLDVVGTGGDLAHTVNISTMAALVVAGAGVRVVKHGNRAASSLCGTADLLEYLGVPLDLGPEAVARCVTEAGIGFCFAARFHPGMRHTGPVRRELGVPTVFNFLGPLSNPARPRAGAVGCFDPR
ncbi:anthranilate phosphoribosyltransferase, partial [Micromonospora azadirachtae]